MMSIRGVSRRGAMGLTTARFAAIALSVFAAGCSADVTRFDSSSFNLNDPETNPPVPSAPVRGAGVDYPAVAHTTPPGPYGAGASDGSVEMSALPEPEGAPSAATFGQSQVQPVVQPYRTAAVSAPPPPSQAIAAGETIEVQPGDTLYRISKQHQVSLSELMSVNGLSNPTIKPGQKLRLPAEGAVAGASIRAPRPIETAAVNPPPAPVMTPVSSERASAFGSTYTVKPGDSIYAIARAHNVGYGELQSVNGIADPRKVRPGTVLKVPGAAPVAAAEKLIEPSPEETAPPAGERPVAATTLNSANKVAALNDKQTDAVAESAPAAKPEKTAFVAPKVTTQGGDSVKLRWPASGKVIAPFGGRPDGTHNDGINLAVPLGTDVHAAESGVVAYAGSELKGYGNLVLVRHDNGWVTAYAHNDELMVKRGDKVRRGQVIGKAGKTGTVDQPQVHFELRQGSKPVDPTPYMEQL